LVANLLSISKQHEKKVKKKRKREVKNEEREEMIPYFIGLNVFSPPSGFKTLFIYFFPLRASLAATLN
jgi:hypothetical protein